MFRLLLSPCELGKALAQSAGMAIGMAMIAPIKWMLDRTTVVRVAPRRGGAVDYVRIIS